jgi:hypothetical protein
MRTLLCRCTHFGLCNRLIYLVSSKAIAEILGAKLVCVWKPSFECDAEWPELFMEDSWFGLSGVPAAGGESISVGKVWFDQFYRKYLKDVCRWEDFRHLALKYLAAIQPTDEIQRLVRDHIRDDGYTALHIRMTDNVRWFKKTKLSFTERFASLGDFLEVIAGEVESGMHVFVATDNRKVQQEIERVYGDGVFFLGKAWRTRFCFVPRRNLRIGEMLQMKRTTPITAALAELWILSTARRLHGTCYSSYSKLAAVLGGISDFHMVTRRGPVRSKDVDMMILNGDPLDGDDES